MTLPRRRVHLAPSVLGADRMRLCHRLHWAPAAGMAVAFPCKRDPCPTQPMTGAKRITTTMRYPERLVPELIDTEVSYKHSDVGVRGIFATAERRIA